MVERLTPARELVARFKKDVAPLIGAKERLGIAVSGGPDSLALLLLASAALPKRIEAATIDHGLRRESADEARFVGSVCEKLGIRHAILEVDVEPGASLQAKARHARYRALGDWAANHGLAAVATAHHADDQAETLLMRLARGAGLSGLAATRRKRPLAAEVSLIRPLLDWRRKELAGIVTASGLTAVDDPANRDPRHDRSKFRSLVEGADWAEASRIASSAKWLAEAEEALEWTVARLIPERMIAQGTDIAIDPAELPHELARRLVIAAFDRLGAQRPRGPELERAMMALAAKKTVTLAGLRLQGGKIWRISPAPPRRRG